MGISRLAPASAKQIHGSACVCPWIAQLIGFYSSHEIIGLDVSLLLALLRGAYNACLNGLGVRLSVKLIIEYT